MENNPTWMPVVALALHDGKGRWLMHRRPDHKQHGGLWEFPGGKVEPGETPVIALIREIEEELAIAIPRAALVPAGFAEEEESARECPIVILLYTCGQWKGEAEALEGGEIGWFAPDEVAALAKPPLDRVLSSILFQKRSD